MARSLPAALVALAAFAAAGGCGTGGERTVAPRVESVAGARVGVEAVPSVTLLENHASSLVVWRRAGCRDRILVHIDGHSDLDWLPDATIARLAAADPDELEALELHPYALDGLTHERFGIWNFVYPAMRLGVVREMVWVVPDGTMDTPERADALVRRLILGKMQMVSLDEAKTLKLDGRRVRGTVLGVPITICELADLPAFREPVLLDLDLDFLTTRSGTTQEVTAFPWITPESLVARLGRAGVRTDIATLSLSTLGGYLPPACRWVGPAARDALIRPPDADSTRWAEHAAADAAEADGRLDEATAIRRRLVARAPDDAAAWYALSRAELRAGREDEARACEAKAVHADPVLADAALFEADALWLNQRYPEALEAYRAYRRARPGGPFLAYALRREAGCLMRTGRDDEAIETFRRVVALAPRHGDTRLDLGVLLRDRGDLEGAVAELREARRILPAQGAYALALGMTYVRQGRLDDALREVADAADRRPTWAQAQLDLGVLLLETGRASEAAAPIAAAVSLDPTDARIAAIARRLRRSNIATTGNSGGR